MSVRHLRRRRSVGAALASTATIVVAATSGLESPLSGAALDEFEAAIATAPPTPAQPAADARTTAAAAAGSTPQSTGRSATSSTTAATTTATPIRNGDSGAHVAAVQRRLDLVGFDPGPVDGQFGVLTEQAVWAYEKLVLGVPHGEATGTVTDDLWQRLAAQQPIRPRRSNAAGEATYRHTEVYLPEQVVAFFVGDEPALVAHMSSGSGENWTETVTIDPGEYRNEHGDHPIQLRLRGRSITPGGVYTYDRTIDGRRRAALGSLYDPAYFNGGIAVHGADWVPLHPSSHGCIRISRFLSARFHELIDVGDQVFVFDGDNEPEWLGQVPPPADEVIG